MENDIMGAMRLQPRTRRAVYPLIVLAGVLLAFAAAGADLSPTVARAHATPRARDPAAAFAKRLNLDPKQRAHVRRLLAIRQARIRRIWTDPVIDADDRVGAVKAINDQTAAQIRALLTEEQSKKYFQARPAGSLATEPNPSAADSPNTSRRESPGSNLPRWGGRAPGSATN